MKRTCVVEFSAENPYQLQASISREEYMNGFQSCSQFSIQLIGDSDSSLITIHNAADFLDFKSDVVFEWNFTKSDYVEKNTLLAIIHAI